MNCPKCGKPTRIVFHDIGLSSIGLTAVVIYISMIFRCEPCGYKESRDDYTTYKIP